MYSFAFRSIARSIGLWGERATQIIGRFLTAPRLITQWPCDLHKFVL